MRKALVTASVASMLDNFNRNNIKLLLEAGYKVTLASNFSGEDDSSPLSKLQRFQAEMEAEGCQVVQIDFSRKVANIPGQLKSYHQLKEVAKEGFSLVHCNSPICAAMTRLAFRKYRKRDGHFISDRQEKPRDMSHKRLYGTRVIYTAHGFHFYKGAPLKNWLLYFPVECVCARWTDILNTINREDYAIARKWLKAKKVVYLPGAGIDMEKFQKVYVDREAVRESLDIKENEKMLLSVGELSRRKNHEAVIRALKFLKDKKTLNRSETQIACFPDIKYVLCGQGEKETKLKALSQKLGIENNVIFLGYRENIQELCMAADLFVLPSLQEGLPMALLEAMALRTPVICSDIRGNRELIEEKEFLFDPRNEASIADCILGALASDLSGAVENHYIKVGGYKSDKVARRMKLEYLCADAGKAMTEDAGR